MMKTKFPIDEDSHICLYSTQIEYIQNGDTWSNGETQSLKLKTEHVSDDTYYVLETSRWAFDNIDEFIEILEDFKKRTTTEK